MSKTLIYSMQFILCAVIFGSSWIAISFQVHDLGYIWPVSMRFLIGGVILGLIAIGKKQLKRPDFKHLLLISLLMFGVNFIFIYAAGSYLKSGLNSLVCSTVIFFNCLSSGLFLKQSIRPSQILAAILGVAGLTAVLSGHLNMSADKTDLITGVSLGLAGTLITSLGQIVFVKMRQRGDEILSINCFGMITGALLLAGYEWTKSGFPVLPDSSDFYSALMFLAIFPTALGFILYHDLMDRVGPQKSAYVFILAPAIAMAISFFAESYQLSVYDGFGFLLILAGFKLIVSPGKVSRLSDSTVTEQESTLK